jgi:ribonuclease T1
VRGQSESPASSSPPTSAPVVFQPPAVPPSKPNTNDAPTQPRTTNRALDLDEVPANERDAVEQITRRIDAGGPFAYDKDNTVFQNRERRLPKQRAGFYREFTVDTPGSRDRGARRIISAEDGALYYTRDHYDSFVRIRGPS